jgi:hypothetical protein
MAALEAACASAAINARLNAKARRLASGLPISPEDVRQEALRRVAARDVLPENPNFLRLVVNEMRHIRTNMVESKDFELVDRTKGDDDVDPSAAPADPDPMATRDYVDHVLATADRALGPAATGRRALAVLKYMFEGIDETDELMELLGATETQVKEARRYGREKLAPILDRERKAKAQ